MCVFVCGAAVPMASLCESQLPCLAGSWPHVARRGPRHPRRAAGRTESVLFFHYLTVIFHCCSVTSRAQTQVLGSFPCQSPQGPAPWASLRLAFCISQQTVCSCSHIVQLVCWAALSPPIYPTVSHRLTMNVQNIIRYTQFYIEAPKHYWLIRKLH